METNLLQAAGVVAVSFSLAFLAEGMTEYLFGTIADHILGADKYKWLLQYVAAAAGVGLAIFYAIDLIQLTGSLAGMPMDNTVVGQVLSGLVIGRGANYLHQFVSTYLPGNKAAG